MAIAIIDNTSFVPATRERSTTTTAKPSGRRGPLASVIAMAGLFGSTEIEAPVADLHERSRQRDQATIDHWMRSLSAQ